MKTFKYSIILAIILIFYHTFFPSCLSASDADIDRAIELYNNAEFEASRDILEKILETGTDPQRQAAFVFLALIEQAHGNTEIADKHIHNLFSLAPSFDLGPYEDLLFPELRQRFEKIRPSVGILCISSNPSGASVFLDGKNVGKTPKKIQIPKKKCTVKLHKTGFKKWRKTISVALAERLERFKLSLNTEKTKLVMFARPGTGNSKGGGTFDFLGFTYYRGRSRRGKWVIKKRTNRKRKKRFLKSLWEWCGRNRHKPVPFQHLRLCQKLRGYYQYFGVRGNYESIHAVYVCAKKFWRYWLSRRSHKGGMDWKKFDKFTGKYPLPRPRIVHNDV